MIRREFLLVFILLLLVFTGISYFKHAKHRIHPNPDQGTDSASMQATFWNCYNQASSYRLQGQPEKAAAAYHKALSLQPDHEDALYYAGIVDREMDSLHAAQQCWEKLTTLNPQSERAFMQLGNLYLSIDNPAYFHPDQASAYYRKAADLNRESPLPWLRLSEIALYKNDLGTATKLLGNLAVMDGKNPEIPFLEGYIRWKRRTGAAPEHPERLLAKIQSSPEYRHKLKQGLFQPWLGQIQAPVENSLPSQPGNWYGNFDRFLARLRNRMNR